MKIIMYRKLKVVNIGEWRCDLISFRLVDCMIFVDFDELVYVYDDILVFLIEWYVFLCMCIFINRLCMFWFNDKWLLGRDVVLNENGKGLVFMNILLFLSV